MQLFNSPQTNSTYLVVADFDYSLKVCYRKIGEDTYRVRIQGDEQVLRNLNLFANWGNVKEYDHLSVVVNGMYLPIALGDAVSAIASATLV